MNNRKSWDLYFLRIAREVSKNSSCLSRKIGAVLVKDKAIISTGYNGPSRGVKHCNERTVDFYAQLNNTPYSDLDREVTKWQKAGLCPRRLFGYKSGEGLHLCQAVHAERNSLIQAARNGVSTKDTVLYCNCPIPCKDCCKEIINAGVKKIVCLKGQDYDKYAKVLLEEAKIKVLEYNIVEL